MIPTNNNYSIKIPLTQDMWLESVWETFIRFLENYALIRRSWIGHRMCMSKFQKLIFRVVFII